MKYLTALAIGFTLSFAVSAQIQQLKVEKYQVTLHTQFVPTSNPALQQVVNISLTGKPLDAASTVTSALIQITMTPVPLLPPFYNAAAKSIVVYAGNAYYATVMDLIDRSIVQKKFSLVLQLFTDAATNTATADLSVR